MGLLALRGFPTFRKHPGGEVGLLLGLRPVLTGLGRGHLPRRDLLTLRRAGGLVQTALLEGDRLLTLAAADRDLRGRLLLRCHRSLLKAGSGRPNRVCNPETVDVRPDASPRRCRPSPLSPGRRSPSVRTGSARTDGPSRTRFASSVLQARPDHRLAARVVDHKFTL